MKAATQRVQQLTDEIGRQIETWTLLPLVQALTVLRGFQQRSAVIVAAEIGDFARFAHPSSLMDFVGLVPSEASSGEKRWLRSLGPSRRRLSCDCAGGSERCGHAASLPQK